MTQKEMKQIDFVITRLKKIKKQAIKIKLMEIHETASFKNWEFFDGMIHSTPGNPFTYSFEIKYNKRIKK